MAQQIVAVIANILVPHDALPSDGKALLFTVQFEGAPKCKQHYYYPYIAAQYIVNTF